MAHSTRMTQWSQRRIACGRIAQLPVRACDRDAGRAQDGYGRSDQSTTRASCRRPLSPTRVYNMQSTTLLRAASEVVDGRPLGLRQGQAQPVLGPLTRGPAMTGGESGLSATGISGVAPTSWPA